MTRSRDEVEQAIDAAARHAWDGHAWQGMYTTLGIKSEEQLHRHIVDTVWSEATECFAATNNREVFYDHRTNTRVILFYHGAGTCLITRAGEREFRKQYEAEVDRYLRSGSPEHPQPAIVTGGISALHPDIGLERQAQAANPSYNQAIKAVKRARVPV